MAILNMNELLASLSTARRQNIYKASSTSEGVGTFQSLVRATGYPIAGPVPTAGTGQIPTRNDTYTLEFTNPTEGRKQYLARVNLSCSTSGSLIIYDRLWVNSGLVGNIITSQAVNSLALTRSVDGIGVEIFLEVYTAMGATGSTFTVTYTDGDNISRTGTYIQPANALTVGQMCPFILTGRGVKSIQSVILSISTGTAGNFGLTLLRRIVDIPFNTPNIPVNLDSFALGLPELPDNSALCMMANCTTTNTGNLIGTIDLIEG